MADFDNNSSSNYFDLEVFLTLLFHGKTLIIVSLIVTVGVTGIMSLAAPRLFESTVKVIAEPAREQNPYLLDAESHQDRRAFIETQKELVISSTVLKGAIAISNNRDPKDVSQKEIESFAKRVSVRSRAGMRDALFNSDGIGESNSFFITVRATDAERAADEANALVEAYLEASTLVRRSQALVSYELIRQTVEETSKRTKAAHEALVDFESEAGELLPELMNIDKPTQRVFPELEDLRANYQQSRVELSGLKATVEELRANITDTEEGASPTVPTDILQANATLQLLRQKEVEFAVELNDIRPFFTDDSREVVSLHEKIRLTREQIRDEMEKMLKSVESKSRILAVVQKSREDALGEYQEKLAELSKKNSRYSELKRQYSSLAQTEEAQRETMAETLAAANQAAGGVSIAVLDDALPDYRAVAPRPIRNILLSVPVGFGIGVFLTFLAFISRPIFLHPRQVSAVTGLPIVGIMTNKQGASS